MCGGGGGGGVLDTLSLTNGLRSSSRAPSVLSRFRGILGRALRACGVDCKDDGIDPEVDILAVWIRRFLTGGFTVSRVSCRSGRDDAILLGLMPKRRPSARVPSR